MIRQINGTVAHFTRLYKGVEVDNLVVTQEEGQSLAILTLTLEGLRDPGKTVA